MMHDNPLNETIAGLSSPFSLGVADARLGQSYEDTPCLSCALFPKKRMRRRRD
jgi:hypothetical protein